MTHSAPLCMSARASSIGRRLRQHDGDEQKEFFDRAIVFVSKDENLDEVSSSRIRSPELRNAYPARCIPRLAG